MIGVNQNLLKLQRRKPKFPQITEGEMGKPKMIYITG